MKQPQPARIAATALVGLAIAAGWGGTQDAGPSPSARSRAMRELAGAVAVEPAGGGPKAGLVGEPIYRFDDPARSYSDGTLWAFGESGRPAALLCLSLQKSVEGQWQWVHELTSLSGGPLAAGSRHASGSWGWRPRGAGLAWQSLPDAPAPGDDEAKRLRQMRDLARRFKAFESVREDRDDPSDRYELRLLPQPLHRYADPASGATDGAIFLLAYGRNPELALVIEARREGPAGLSWSYGLARLGAARIRVSFDGREVADLTKPSLFDPTSTYFLLVRPAVGLGD